MSHVRFRVHHILLTLSLLSFASFSSGFTGEHPYRPGELIIKLKEGVASLTNLPPQWQPLNKKGLSLQSGPMIYKASYPGLNGAALKEKAKAIQNEWPVAYVEPNYIYELNETIPDDPLFERLYGLSNTGQTGGAPGSDLNVTSAWDEGVGSRAIAVAVVDTGIDYEHEDLAANIFTNEGETGLDANGESKEINGIDDDGNGYIDDVRGYDFINQDNDPMDDHDHGTHCAGTIGAIGNNGIGVSGVNWEVTLVPIKIFSGTGRTHAAAIVEALLYSATLPIHISSNSWGGGAYSEAIFDAMKNYEEKGILVVAAAGNEGRNTDDRPKYPAGYELANIVSVGSVDHWGELSYFSNYGYKSVDVVAPGSNILSTRPGGSYQLMSGTSMATPHIAGVAALIWSRFQEEGYFAIKSRLLYNARQTDPLFEKIRHGYANVQNSMEEDDIAPNSPSGLSMEVDEDGQTAVIRFHPSGDDGASGLASDYVFKVSETPLTSPKDWQNAESIQARKWEPQKNQMIMTLELLEAPKEGYISVRSIDNVGLMSPLSEALFYQKPEADTP